MEKFERQLILACKGWYANSLPTIEILQRMWAIRCGYDFDCIDNASLQNIANRLFKILCNFKSPEMVMELVHNEVSKTYSDRYKKMSPIEVLILEYVSQIVWVKTEGLDLKVIEGLNEMILEDKEINWRVYEES